MNNAPAPPEWPSALRGDLVHSREISNIAGHLYNPIVRTRGLLTQPSTSFSYPVVIDAPGNAL